MKITTCTIQTPHVVQLSARIKVQFSRTIDDELLVTWGDKKSTVVLNAIDFSQQLDEASVYVLQSNSREEVLLFGGEKAYYLSENDVEFAFDIPRSFGDLAEYASATFEETSRGLLCVFETGLVLIDGNLRKVWSVDKYVNDFFVRVNDDTVVLRYDHDQEWRLSLADGSKSVVSVVPKPLM
jgi:hypothetical protein